MLLEALLAFCFRGLRALLCDAEAMREHLRSSHEEPHNGDGLSPGQGRGGTRWPGATAGLWPPVVAERQGGGTHGCWWRCGGFREVAGSLSGHAVSSFSRLRGSWGLCVPALKLGSESVVMRFYYVFWQGLVILCVDLLYNELSDFEMFCATIFWKGHCILFMGCVSFYETLFSF